MDNPRAKQVTTEDLRDWFGKGKEGGAGGGWKSEETEEPSDTQAATSADLEWGSDSATRIYRAMTPGQENEAWEKNPNCQQCGKKLSPQDLKKGNRICATCHKQNKGKVWGNDADDDYTESVTEAYLTELGNEAEYEGRAVTLDKPFRTADGPKKFSVYVNNEKGNVVKVNFGDPDMEIKRDDPDRRANYRARHNCDDPGPKWKANYWSCKNWSSTPVSKITEEPAMHIPTFKEYLLTEAEGGQLTSQVKAAFANAAAAFAKIVPEDQIYAVAAICEYLASQSLYGPEKSYLLSISKHLEELHDLVNARASDKVRPARSADKIAAIARDSHNQEVQAARARYSLMMHQVSIVKAAFAKMAPEDQIYAVAEFCNYLISQPLYSPEKSVLRATSNQLEKLHDRVSARVLGNQLFTRTH